MAKTSFSRITNCSTLIKGDIKRKAKVPDGFFDIPKPKTPTPPPTPEPPVVTKLVEPEQTKVETSKPSERFLLAQRLLQNQLKRRQLRHFHLALLPLQLPV